MTNEEAKMFLDNLKRCIDEHPVVADWLVEIENRKTENSSEKPNNCESQITMDCSKCRLFTDGGEECDLCALGIIDEPQTDCAWK